MAQVSPAPPAGGRFKRVQQHVSCRRAVLWRPPPAGRQHAGSARAGERSAGRRRTNRRCAAAAWLAGLVLVPAGHLLTGKVPRPCVSGCCSSDDALSLHWLNCSFRERCSSWWCCSLMASASSSNSGAGCCLPVKALRLPCAPRSRGCVRQCVQQARAQARAAVAGTALARASHRLPSQVVVRRQRLCRQPSAEQQTGGPQHDLRSKVAAVGGRGERHQPTTSWPGRGALARLARPCCCAPLGSTRRAEKSRS